ncbi:hypothetical protein like AT5G39785 [Hibiscus trionum]|uniref:Ribosomal protein L34Ae n=2 Tax=Hibiscus trionum TaxID=183268 RepID=A0A9W7LKA3_HIBTR|nr:hypothetical protein like AT5G39785 [Hibiscus trionum]
MGSLYNFMTNTHFYFKNMTSFNVFFFQNLVPFGGFFLVSISAQFSSLFEFFSKGFSGIQSDRISELNSSIPIETEDSTEEKTNETKPDAMESKGEDSESIEEENESPKFFFKFQYQTQTFEELRKKFEENENFNVGLDSIPCTSTNKYEFKSENDLCCIMEKPEDLSFCVKELYADSSNGLLSEQGFLEQNLKDLSENEVDDTQQSKQTDCENVSGKLEFLSEDCTVSDTDMDSITSSPEKLSNFEAFELDFEADSSSSIEDQDIKEELRKLEELDDQNKDSNALDNSEESNLENPLASDSEDSNGLETLWEHQELMEQLKMELKKVKATGLPTILEESESPKITDDLKPWKIDEKFQYADRMTELHKFYKSYRERMRKFDILNYQKMYAIGLLHSKDPFQSISTQKSSSAAAIASLLPQNLRPGRRKTSDSDPMSKFINELHSDLEMVYVGQMCLSWEILHWQYAKAIEIWESDPYCLRRYKYNEVAGEFQQFQVLIQRFIENEPFEGPRVPNYIKNRCVLRNLLQVPVIREDSLKDKRKGRRKGRDDDGGGGGVITADMLLEMLEESIRIFWRFIRADKDANIVIRNVRKGAQVEPLEPDELELLAAVQTSLQKKDKKLREMVRSGNCMLRRLKKNEGENSDQVLYFFSQVDLKLVARVLNMSKVTKDQLFWCHSKLSNINFVNRKINVDPSFLIFPC